MRRAIPSLKRVELSKNACNSLALTDWMGRSPMVRISTLIKAFIGFSLFLRPRPEFRQFLQPVLECAGFQANHLASVVFFCSLPALLVFSDEVRVAEFREQVDVRELVYELIHAQCRRVFIQSQARAARIASGTNLNAAVNVASGVLCTDSWRRVASALKVRITFR